MSSAGAEPWLTYTFTWHTFSGCCERCYRLDGRQWPNMPLLQGTLSAPEEGDVYNLDADISLVHPNCRCWLEAQVNVDLNRIEEFRLLGEQVGVLRGIKLGESIVPGAQTSFTSTGGLELFREQVDGLKADVDNATFSLRECEYILFRTTRILSRMGLPPEIDSAITKIQRMIMIIRMLHSAMIAMQMGTPYGWIMGGISVAGTVISAASLMEMERPTY